MKPLVALLLGVLLAELLEECRSFDWSGLAAYLSYAKAWGLWRLGVAFSRWGRGGSRRLHFALALHRVRFGLMVFSFRCRIGYAVCLEFCSELRRCLFHRPPPIVGRRPNSKEQYRHSTIEPFATLPEKPAAGPKLPVSSSRTINTSNGKPQPIP